MPISVAAGVEPIFCLMGLDGPIIQRLHQLEVKMKVAKFFGPERLKSIQMLGAEQVMMHFYHVLDCPCESGQLRLLERVR